MNECQLCGRETDKKLTPMHTKRGDWLCCDKCVGEYESYADMEYERQREEGVL